jgi:hypothetical protein
MVHTFEDIFPVGRLKKYVDTQVWLAKLSEQTRRKVFGRSYYCNAKLPGFQTLLIVNFYFKTGEGIQNITRSLIQGIAGIGQRDLLADLLCQR